MKPIVENYTQSLLDFKKNAHKEISNEWKEYISKRWDKSFKEFGYKKE